MLLLRFLALFVTLSAGIYFVIRILRFSNNLAPFLVIAADGILLYFFALVNILKIGFYVACLVSIGLGIFALVDQFRHKDRKSNLFTPCIFIWIGIFAILILYTYGTLFYQWDEFSYWGPFYKYLMATNHLPTDITNFLNIAYPPFSGLIQYFAGQFLGNKESSAYFGQMLFEFSILLAIFPEKKMGWVKYSFSLLIASLSVIYASFQFQSIYVDLLLALLFGLSIVNAAFHDHSSKERITMMIIACVSLALTKPTGIGLALICYFFYVFDRADLFSSHKRNKVAHLFKTIFQPQPLILLMVLLAVYLGWNIHAGQLQNIDFNISVNGQNGYSSEVFPIYNSDTVEQIKKVNNQIATDIQFYQKPQVINISLVGFFRNFSVNATYPVKQTIAAFINNFSTKQFRASKMTQFEDFLLLFLVLMISFLFSKRKNILEGDLLPNLLILFFGFLLYSFMILVAYIYYFPPAEAMSAPTSVRYLATYLLGWWLFILCLVMNEDYKPIAFLKFDISYLMGLAISIFLILSTPFASYLHLPSSPSPERFWTNAMYKLVSQVVQNNDKVFLVNSNDDSKGLDFYMFKYFFNPIPTNNYGWNLTTNDRSNDYSAVYIQPDKWLKLLQDQHYTYVYIVTSDPEFWLSYGKIFDSYSEKITFDGNIEPQLFKVTSNGLINIPIDDKFYFN